MYNVCMVKRLNITLPEELIKTMDSYCVAHYLSRSELIKDSVISTMQIVEGVEAVADLKKPSTWVACKHGYSPSMCKFEACRK